MTGWCDSRTGFSKFSEACSTNRRIIKLDWPGHGKSDKPPCDFGFNELVDSAVSVINDSGVREVIPVSGANAGWVSIELLSRLKERVPKLVFMDWVVLQPPHLYLDMLHSLRNPGKWESTRNELLSTWLKNVNNSEVQKLVKEIMSSFGRDMWSRAAREIILQFNTHSSPLHLLRTMGTNVPVMHLYSQPNEPGYFESQELFAASHEWFKVFKINTRSHFFTLEKPNESAILIEKFINDEHLTSFHEAI